MNLSETVRRYVAEARRSPALAVGAALDELDAASRLEFDRAFAVNAAAIAPHTWMARARLLAAEAETQPDQIPLGEPVEIVGFFPTLLTLEAGGTVPPLEAIDVMLELKRKELLTARAESGVAAGEDFRVVNLPMISSAVANRLIGYIADANDPVLTVKFRWAVEPAIVTALGWNDVQISLGIFVRPLGGK